MFLHDPRRRRRLVAAAAALATFAGIAAPSTVSAAQQTRPVSFEFSGSQPQKKIFSTGTIICDECYPDGLAGGTEVAIGMLVEATVDIDYTASASGSVSYDDALLRQGAQLPITTAMSAGAGNVHATWRFVYDAGVFQKNADQEWVGLLDLSGVPDVVFEQDFPCTVPIDGVASCDPAAVLSFPIVGIPVVPGLIDIGLNFNINFTMDVGTDGIVAMRSLDVVGGAVGADEQPVTIGGSPASLADLAEFGCDEPVGNTVGYGLVDPTLAVDSELGLGASLDVEFEIADVSTNLGTLWETGFATLDDLPPVDLHAADAFVDLGELGVDNIAPTVGGAGTYDGVEGSPVAMSVTADDNCGAPVVRWAFSDGGVAFGPDVNHVFADDGDYSALVTATDAAGNVDAMLVLVEVANAAPVAEAGPDHTTAWGRPVTFGGAGVDPSTVDQGSLVSSWDFGDGSPSAAGGALVVHTYDAPGTYVSTYEVCDQDGACDVDTRTVTVERRAADISVAGPAQATFDTPTTLVADVIDEFGQPVVNRTVTFLIDGQVVGTANTNGVGTAALLHAPQVAAGTHQLTASVASDSRYEGATSAGADLQIARKSTTMSYTGAVTGGPKKTVTLSATIVDATGRPLAGRTVSFQLGTQSATATTDANGQAVTALKLLQKNGTYSVSATWTASGADADRYSGSSASTTFKLQSR